MTALATETPAPVAPMPGAAPLAAVVPLTDLYPSPSNPRTHFDGLNELALSISRKGIEIPLIVRRRETAAGLYEIIDGERRFRASQQAGIQFAPIIVREKTDAEVLEMQLENAVQREGLTPLEEARGFKALLTSNPSRYSAAYIADRISRSERYVMDRMRLLSLIPELQRLLEADVIGVAHAELLAKLKPEDQARAVEPSDGPRDEGGLWQSAGATLDFDDRRDESNPYAGLKPVTVKELEAWIARHVRFDVEHMATTAPLEFGRVAGLIQTAGAQPGRGKKVIEITHDHHLADEVKDPSARVYGPRSWKRADGTIGRDLYGAPTDAPTCEHSVLGVVAVGPEYGTAFQVCIAKEKCRTHWGDEIKAREKSQQLRASGKTTEADASDRQQESDYQARQRREEEARARDNAFYAALHPALVAALAAKLPKVFDARAFRFVWEFVRGGTAPKVKPEEFVRALVLGKIEPPKADAWYPQGAISRAVGIARQFGVDTKPLEQAAREQVAAAAKAAKKAAKGGGTEPAAAAPATRAKEDEGGPAAAKKKTARLAKRR